MKKTRGFLILESMIAFMLVMIGIMALELVFVTGQKNRKISERQTDQALANYIFRQVNVDQLSLHDKIYRRAEDAKN